MICAAGVVGGGGHLHPSTPTPAYRPGIVFIRSQRMQWERGKWCDLNGHSKIVVRTHWTWWSCDQACGKTISGNMLDELRTWQGRSKDVEWTSKLHFFFRIDQVPAAFIKFFRMLGGCHGLCLSVTGALSTLVALATFNFHGLIMGKMKICICRYFDESFLEMYLECSSTKHILFVQTCQLIGCHGNKKAKVISLETIWG